jgi:hypothetical protein
MGGKVLQYCYRLPARRAVAAIESHDFANHPVAGFELGDFCPDFAHDAEDFMPGNNFLGGKLDTGLSAFQR